MALLTRCAGSHIEALAAKIERLSARAQATHDDKDENAALDHFLLSSELDHLLYVILQNDRALLNSVALDLYE